jgi:signal transduction histidine kinase
VTASRVLVVEDEAVVARDLRETLEECRYSVLEVVDTEDAAVRAAGMGRPDLVLMDIHLRDGGDGAAAAVRIRERFDIPVVYVTAHTDDKVMGRAKAADPYGYIPKPFEKSQLRAAIEVALHKHRRDKEAQEARAEESRRLQLLLQHSERLSAMGRMTAGIAHELKAPLGIIHTVSALLLRKPPESERPRLLANLKDQSKRCADLVDVLLRFARRDARTLEDADVEVGEAVAGALSLLRPSLMENFVKLVFSPAESLRVRAPRGLLDQVVINLGMNAVDAMGKEGTLTVKTDRVWTAGGVFARLEVADTGPGVPREQRERIFEPFFTTKEAANGTGLGLWLAREFVERMGGQISCGDAAGGGAAFRVDLPLLPEGQ